ncbi:MAG: FHA domain-containing protein, partial [Myxococcales bacterium]|nr:FHA domain-containing protein [Myxococcales bacterium]
MSDEGVAISVAQTADVQRSGRDVLELVVLEQGSVSRRILTPSRTLRIGRAHECDVVVQDPAASRRHALLYVEGELAIEDLDSRNGTRLRGARVCPRRRIPLKPGDAVQIGATILLVQGASADEQPQPGAGERSAAVHGGLTARHDPEMRAVHESIARVSPSQLTVLISGETGVGKE